MKTPKHKPLSKRETAWIARLQKVLDACPNKRLGFFTIGDQNVTVYDRRFDSIIEGYPYNNMDFCTVVDELGIDLGTVDFPAEVHSTAG